MPEAKPIGSGQAFIGLCTLRNGAVQMLWWRASFGILLNFTGLAAAAYQFVGNPGVLVLVLLAIGASLAIHFNDKWRELIASGKRAEEHWTEELVQLEDANGIDGGCRIFHHGSFPAPGPKPRVPKVLRGVRHMCMVLWGVVFAISLTMFFMKEEVWSWIGPLWQSLSFLLSRCG